MTQSDKQGEVNQKAADSKAAFLSSLQVDLETVEVEGCTVQALSDIAYQRVKAKRNSAAASAKADERQEAYEIAERAAMLEAGVVEPKMTFAEWKHVLNTANIDKVETILQAIRERSGIRDMDMELVKKALEQTPGAT